MSLFDDVKNNLVEWYSISSEKTAEVAKVTTRRYDKFGISRDIERQFGELGSLVYNGVREGREDITEDPSVLALISRIQGLEEELRLKNEEIGNIQHEYSERRARTGASATGAAGAEGGFDQEDIPVQAAETVLKQPILDVGSEESAILVEPIVVDVEENEVAASQAGEIEEELHPEKDA
jgi:hypothetical protein